MNRRAFLVGLFGTAAVVAAGSIPAVIEALPEKDFKAAVEAWRSMAAEVYGDDKGNYGFATIKYLNKAPWLEVSIPEGFRPLRAESDRIGAEAIAKMRGGNNV